MKRGRVEDHDYDGDWQVRLRALSERATLTVNELSSTLTEMSKIVQSFMDNGTDNEVVMGGDKRSKEEIEDRGDRK